MSLKGVIVGVLLLVLLFLVLTPYVTYKNALSTTDSVAARPAGDDFVGHEWFELARTPNSFQREGHKAVAKYTENPDYRNHVLHFLFAGKPAFKVYNRSIPYSNATDQTVRSASGHAWASEKEDGQYAVSFFPVFFGSYRIIYRKEDLAVVWDKNQSMWVLQRDKAETPVSGLEDVLNFLKDNEALLPTAKLKWHPLDA